MYRTIATCACPGGAARKVHPEKSADVLLHMMGHVRKVLTKDEMQELLEVIARYRNKLVPLLVPVTLIAHHVRKYGSPTSSCRCSFLPISWN